MQIKFEKAKASLKRPAAMYRRSVGQNKANKPRQAGGRKPKNNKHGSEKFRRRLGGMKTQGEDRKIGVALVEQSTECLVAIKRAHMHARTHPPLHKQTNTPCFALRSPS